MSFGDFTEPGWIDIGDRHYMKFTQWSPDRDLNPQYEGIPDIDPCGVIVGHYDAKTGEPCEGVCLFNTPEVAKLWPDHARWDVSQMDPLTMHPSILCMCGDHGFITNGSWIRA